MPWKTLGLPDLRDGDGERLWYSVQPEFVHSPPSPSALNRPINTDTISNGIVYSGDATNVMVGQEVAVVFAPGAPVGTQARSPTQTALCATTGTTIVQSRCADNYLDSVSGINNANATDPYIEAPPTATFNDRLIVINNIDLMTPIEARAAKAMLIALQAYKAGSWFCNCYPWADVSDGIANDGLENGRLPLNSADTGHGNDWANAGVTIPQWLLDNQWWFVFFYTVAPNRTYNHTFGSLTVNGVSGTDVVLISSGAQPVADRLCPAITLKTARTMTPVLYL